MLAAKHGVAHSEGIGETRVRDIWTWDDNVDPDWLSQIEDDYPPAFAVVKAVEACATENEAAYIAFMAIRLIECRRVLKPMGSIYVHCDDHANGYLRLLMDGVFGVENYMNELVWRRSVAHSGARRYGRITDRILYYGKSSEAYWDGEASAAPKSDAELRADYPSTDERGRFRADNMTGAGVSAGESGEVWRDYDVSARGRHWAAPRTSGYAKYIEDKFIPGYRNIESVIERLDALDAAGLIRHPTRGFWPGTSFTTSRCCTPPATERRATA